MRLEEESSPNEFLERIPQLEEKRREALTNCKAIDYFTLCEQLGIEPEERSLYDKGRLEFSMEEQAEEIKRRTKTSKYGLFYEEGRFLMKANTNVERTLLRKYFPGRFGDKGKQPLRKMGDSQVRKVFEKILKYSEKLIQQ